MKKILTVLLIAVMAAGFVFAGISGKADVRFGYNFAKKTFGFDSSNSEVNFDIDLGSTAVAAGEGDVHAEVEGQVKVIFANETKGVNFLTTYGSTVGLKVSSSWKAKIVGNNWELALKTTEYAEPDFAKSAIDTYRKGTKNVFGKYTGFAWSAVSLAGQYDDGDKVGVEAKVFDNTIGVVFDGKNSSTTASNKFLGSEYNDTKTYTDFKAYLLTKEFNLNGATFQFGGTIVSENIDEYQPIEKVTLENNNTNVATKTDLTSKSDLYGSLSAKIGYAGDKFSGFLAADVELNRDKENAFEVAANAKYDFVAFDAYYVNKLVLDEYNKNGENPEKTTFTNYASAKLGFDFAKFDVPVTFTVTGKNLLWFATTTGTNTGLEYSNNPDFKFEVACNGIIAAAAYFEINTVDAWKLGGSIAYSAAMFDVKVGAYYEKHTAWGKNKFMPTAEISTSKLVPGAVLSVGYYSNTDAKKFDTSSLLDSSDNGKIEAKCVIAF